MKHLLVILSFSVLFFQCDHKDHHDHHHHGHGDLQQELKLDNGKKWKADAPAFEGVQSIGSLVSAFKSGQEYTVEDYNQLGDDISSQLKLIFKECKMEGEGHNQLHTVLHAIMTDADGLSKVKDLKEGERLVQQVQDHADVFFGYFEMP